jgi:hypothetical protein
MHIATTTTATMTGSGDVPKEAANSWQGLSRSHQFSKEREWACAGLCPIELKLLCPQRRLECIGEDGGEAVNQSGHCAPGALILHQQTCTNYTDWMERCRN